MEADHGTYQMDFPPRLTAAIPCPVASCPGSFKTWAGLCTHFNTRHPMAFLCIRQEGNTPLLRCPKCDMQVPYSALNGKHLNSAQCLHATRARTRREAITTAHTAMTQTVSINGTPLEQVTTFSYLGRYITCNNSDWPAVYKNLKKARQKWALIARPLLNTGVPPPMVGLFYKAITQAVLLHGCETWVITPPMLQTLTGFHHKVARRITNHTPRRHRGSTWHYPPIADTLQIAKLYPMEEYIRQRQDTLAVYLATRPILTLCHQTLAIQASSSAMSPTTSCLFRY